MLGLGATDAKGRVGQLKGTGLVLERVYVPQASKPSRVALQQHGGTGEQSVQFVHKSGVVEVSRVEYVTESWLCNLIAPAELPPPSVAGLQHLRSRGTFLHTDVLFVNELRSCRQPLSCLTLRRFGFRTPLSTLPTSKFIVRTNPLPVSKRQSFAPVSTSSGIFARNPAPMNSSEAKRCARNSLWHPAAAGHCD